MIMITVMQAVSALVSKVIQLYETMIVRHGVMLVGPTGGGKTTTYEILKDTLTNLHSKGVENQYYQPVQTYVLNPKVCTMILLYESNNYCHGDDDNSLYLWVSCMVK